MSRQLTQLRNIGVIAHIDAGKTTVTERMLYYSGAKHRVGMVDQGTTETDNDSEEQERGITIYAACVTFEWRDWIINLLDTPGHVDFTAEVERCLRVLDGGVVVFSAREGVEAQSETVWRQADKYRVPRIVFINKMDREGADFAGTLAEIRDRLTANPVALQIPVGQGPPHLPDAFRAVIDLVRMKQLNFSDQRQGPQVTEEPIPETSLEAAQEWRERMLDSLSYYSDDLMERYLSEEEIPDELVRQVIRDATLHHQIQPVLCGSALDGIGVRPLLDAVGHYLPNPLDKPPVTGTNPKSKDRVEHRNPDAKEPFCGLVFKILPAKTGDLYWVRVYAGELQANSRVYNPGKDVKENVSQLWHIHATKRDQKIDSVSTGDIVGLIGPRNSITGDTLCDSKHPVLLESIVFPETVISMAIEPESMGERKKLADVLEMLKKQDPTFRAKESEETGQTIISGMGELHLEVIKHRLLRDFNLNVKFHNPRVSYRESIARAAEVTGECHRQIGGQQLFARLMLSIEPLPAGSAGVVVTSRIPPDVLPPEYLEAALEELNHRAEGGGLVGGFPLIRLKVTVLSGESSAEHSNEIAFRIAAGDAFEKGLREAGPVLLEPIMRLDITTPADYVGEFVGDLQQRRAIIAKTTQRGTITLIQAHVPLMELFGYSMRHAQPQPGPRRLLDGTPRIRPRPLQHHRFLHDVAPALGGQKHRPQILLRSESSVARRHFPVAENVQAGDRAHAVAAGQFRAVVDVHLDDAGVRHLLGQLVEGRRQLLTRFAPVGVEINQDRHVAAEHQLIKVLRVGVGDLPGAAGCRGTPVRWSVKRGQGDSRVRTGLLRCRATGRLRGLSQLAGGGRRFGGLVRRGFRPGQQGLAVERAAGQEQAAGQRDRGSDVDREMGNRCGCESVVRGIHVHVTFLVKTLKTMAGNGRRVDCRRETHGSAGAAYTKRQFTVSLLCLSRHGLGSGLQNSILLVQDHAHGCRQGQQN